MADPVLELRGVRAGYGRTVVLEDCELAVSPGEAVAIIGRNGVGKTTLLTTVMGHTDMHAGDILLDGSSLLRLPPQRRCQLGLGLVPQEREVFPSLSVEENLEVAARPGGEWDKERIFKLFPNLAQRRTNRGNQLSGGEQQMLAIGRALMGNPRLLLMDEPSEGLAPVIVEELQKVMARLRDSGGLTILLVEQNTRVALNFAARAIVMNRGRIVHDGLSEELRGDSEKLAGLMGLG